MMQPWPDFIEECFNAYRPDPSGTRDPKIAASVTKRLERYILEYIEEHQTDPLEILNASEAEIRSHVFPDVLSWNAECSVYVISNHFSRHIKEISQNVKKICLEFFYAERIDFYALCDCKTAASLLDTYRTRFEHAKQCSYKKDTVDAYTKLYGLSSSPRLPVPVSFFPQLPVPDQELLQGIDKRPVYLTGVGLQYLKTLKKKLRQ